MSISTLLKKVRSRVIRHHVNSAQWRRRLAVSRLSSLEALEARLMLNNDYSSNTFARLTGTIATPDTHTFLTIDLSSQSFGYVGGKTLISISVRGTENGGVLPVAPSIRDSAGNPVAAYFAANSAVDALGRACSLLLVDLAPGKHTLLVAGKPASTGGFTVDFSLVGDLDGDRDVDINDRNNLTNLVRNRQYLGTADANGDKRLTSFDTAALLRNLGESTPLSPNLILSASYEPAPTRFAPDGTPFSETPNVNLVGSTRPFVNVELDVDGDGFDDGMTTAAANGSFGFPMVLFIGRNLVRVRVSDGFQSLQADRPIILNRDPLFTTSPTTSFFVPPPSAAPVGVVTPSILEEVLSLNQVVNRSVKIERPDDGTGAVSTVDVFLLFDDTGSFAGTAPTIINLFPTIVNDLRTSFPAIDFAFGVGRFEEYGSFAGELNTGRPFILNQPIVRSASTGFDSALAAALRRSAPGFGGDGPETMIEALYQVATGVGFDGNNDGDRTDSGSAGLASTQTSPGVSGDVPAFSTFVADPAANVLPPAGTIGGVGFRTGALPIILVATDVGTAYQPDGLSNITGAGGLTLPASGITGGGRGSTPGGRGARIQDTITALNNLGALVIGLGTGTSATSAPRSTLEAIARLTGSINNSDTPIDSQISSDPINKNDPLYFRITAGSGSAVASAVGGAITSAVNNVFFDVEVQLEDPTIPFINHTGVVRRVGRGGSATFNVDITGDGAVHSTNLLFVREGSGVLLGSIPLVIDIEDYIYDSDAVDPDGDILTFRLLDGPAEATIDMLTGKITWNPDLASIYHFEVEVSDGQGGHALQSFDLSVTSGGVSLAPTISTAPVTIAKVGRTYSYDVDATDPDMDRLTYYLALAPEGMRIDRNSGLITWDAIASQVGLHPVRVRVLDGRGEEDVQDFTVGVSLPIIPTIGFAPDQDTGFSSVDLVTQLNRPAFTGTAEAGNTIMIYRGTTLVGTTTSIGGVWSFTPPDPLPEGQVLLMARATDAAGNAFDSPNLPIIVDTLAPAQPPTPDLSPASDLGKSDSDDITSALLPVFTGTGESNGRVLLFVDDVFAVEGDISSAGNWSVQLSTVLTEGTRSVRAEIMDAAGNASNRSNALHIMIDASAPPLSFDLDPSFDSAPEGDGLTTFEVVDLSGVTQPGANVTLSRNGSLLAEKTAAPDGSYFFSSISLNFGQNILEAQATDDAGNVTAVTSSFGRLATSSLFADPDLEEAVRKELGISVGFFVTPTAVLDLRHLKADSNVIETLAGLEFAINLESLSLTPTSYAVLGGLSSLASLSGLTKLSELTLQRTGITATTLSTIGTPPALKSLDLRYNAIENLAGVPNPERLTELFLHGNPVTDLSRLAGSLVDLDTPSDEPNYFATIAELAADLHRLPERIFAFVHNQIEFQPYSGLMRGPEATLRVRAGNAYDISRLLQAILQEAGVASKVVTGIVEAPIGEVLDWLGARTPDGAASLMGFAKLNPVSLIGLSGEVEALRFDHAWVEATIPEGMGTRSVRLDAAYKFKDRQVGRTDILSAVPFDESAYLSTPRKESTHEFYEDQVRAYLATNMPSISIADIPYDGPIHPIAVVDLPTALPYNLLGTPTTYDVLPATLQHRVRLSLSVGGINTTLAMPDVAADTVLLGWNDIGAQVIPELIVGGNVVATGTPVFERSSFTLTISHLDSGDDIVDRSFNYVRDAGQWIGIGLDVGQHTDASIMDLQAAVNAAAIDARNGDPVSRQRQVGGLLALAIEKWFHDTDRAGEVIAGLTNAQPIYSFVASGITTGEPTVDYFADLQNPYVPRGLSIDVANNFSQLVALDGSTVGDFARSILTGYNDSAAEHEIWEDLIQTASISTIKSLQLANQRGIPVFVINSANSGTFLPQLTHNLFTRLAISQEIAEGATVTVPRDPTPFNEWRGVGYITRRPGSEGFIISGGLASDSEPLTLASYQGGSPSGDPEVFEYFDPNTGEWVEIYVGDPIHIANGSVKHDEQDFSMPNVGIALDFNRSYDSNHARDRGMGPGWSFSYGDQLVANADGSRTWFDSTGNDLTFFGNGSGGFITPNSLYGTLTATISGHTWRSKTGMTYDFDAAGRLVRHADRFGNGVAVTYDTGDQIATVHDLFDTGRALTFTYTAGRLTGVADFTGRTWNYSYTAGRLTQVNAPTDATTPIAMTSYSYYTDTARAGLLRSVTQPNGGATTFQYYVNGRAQSITNPEGFTQRLSYNIFRSAADFTDERGQTTVYYHNDEANLEQVLYPDRSSESFAWRDSLRTSWTDSHGRTATSEYDSSGNVTRSVDRGGFVTMYTYEPTYSDLTSVTLPGSRTTTLSYDGSGNLTRLRDAENNQTEMTYDTRGRVLTRTAPRGVVTPAPGDYMHSFTYDAAGNVVTRSTDLPSTERWTYDGRGNVVTHVDALNRTTTHDYDLLNRRTGTTDALAQTVSMTYDAIGNLVSYIDQAGRKSTFDYDLRRLQLEIVNTDSTTTNKLYDAGGNLVRSVDELGRVDLIRYDSLNRVSDRTAPDNTVEVIEYDGNGRETRHIDGNGNATSFTYDFLDRLLNETDALGGVKAYTYDAVGNVLSVTDELNRTTMYTYDLLNRRTSALDPGLHRTTMTYDAHSNLQTVTDPLLHTEQYAYDVLDRRVSRIDALGGTTVLSYDAVSNMTSYRDPELNTTTYVYDALNRVREVTNELGRSRTYVYDLPGNLSRMVDRNGRATTYAYDQRNRRIGEQWRDAADNIIRSFTTSYDVAGQLIAATDPDSAYSYTYDALGRVASVSNAGTPVVPEVTFQYVYDAVGNLRSSAETIGAAAGATRSYDYDPLNRVTRITQAGPDTDDKRVDFAYDAASQLNRVERFANVADATPVLTSAYIYDLKGRLSTLAHMRNTTTLADYQWVYDAADRLTQQTSVDGISNYILDNTDQLTGAAHSYQGHEAYTYDDNGNRTNSGYVIGPNNRLLSDGKFNYTYDDEGNRIRSVEVTTGEVTEYAWDHRNRLVGVIIKTAGGTVLMRASYKYDSMNQRIAKTVDADGDGPATAKTESFVHDGGQIALQFDDSGDLTHRYLHGPGVDQVLADESNGEFLWALGDQLGTVRDLTDESGNLLNHIRYDSFGNITGETNRDVDILFGYTGRELDAETGLYNNRARYYDSATGNFLSEDPIGFDAGDPNLARYVENNPLTQVDPTGLDAGSVGAPGFWESLIPIWGSGRAAINDFQEGRWGWGLFNTVLAITDIFLVKALITGGIKLLGKGAATAATRREAAEILAKESQSLVQANRAAGQAAERFLAQTYGGVSQVTKSTTQGTRVIDNLVNGVAQESKVGRTALTSRVERQIQKDIELMRTPGSGVTSVEWHFFPSKTGIGPTAPLLNRLQGAGISVVFH